MKTMLQDVRYAVRQLLKSPGFTATAVLSLACGIAATAAVFSVVWGVLMNPYPYRDAERMAHLSLGSLTDRGGYNGFGVTVPQFEQMRQVTSVQDAMIFDVRPMMVTTAGVPESVMAGSMSSNAFNFFGVPALFGRGLVPSDAVGGEDPQPVVVLGYKFWQRHFDGDPKTVGKTIELGRKPYQIVGVVPPRFTWGDADVYLPLKMVQGQEAYEMEVRLKPGVTRKIAAEQLQPLVTQFAKETPMHFPFMVGPLHVIGLNEQFVKSLGPTLALLFGAVSLLLLIGCGNVSILLLARGAARAHEFAVRAAIGASRGRIVRQLLTESLLLSITGAALGVLLAYKLVSVIVGLLPENSFPHEAAIAVNLPVLVFCVVVALGTGILFGLAPALRQSRPDVREAMQAGTRRVAGSSGGRRLHQGLIGAQIALTLLLIATAGSAIQAFVKLARVPLGFDPKNVMSVGMPLDYKKITTIATRAAHMQVLRDRVAELPGVRAVAVNTNGTPPDSGFIVPVEILGALGGEQRQVHWTLVSPEYFSLLGVPVVEGRLWTEDENHNAAKLAVVNRAFVRKYFPNGDALGHSVKTVALKPEPPAVVGVEGSDGWLQIIGVMGDKLNDGLSKPASPEVSVPYTLVMGPGCQLLVKTDGPPLAMLRAISLKVAMVDSEQQVSNRVRDIDQLIRLQPEYARGQLISWLFGAFAVLALLLAAVGLYSVVSYTVTQRTNEFGIRMALGAMRGNVLGLVLRSTAVSVGGGVLAGVVLTLGLRSVLAHWAAGAATNVVALVGAVAVLGLVAVVASGIPAMRAARIEPMEALRYE